MDIWNVQRVSVVNQMSTRAQEYDDHHYIHTTQHNLLAIPIKDKRKKNQDKMKGFFEYIVSNFSNFIASFHGTTNLLKIYMLIQQP